MELDINNIRIGHRYRKDLGDIKSLAASIEEVGLLHPIVIREDGTLIAGRRRLEACKSLGWSKAPVTVVDLAEVARGEFAENVYRKDFLPSEAVAIWQEMEKESPPGKKLSASESFSEPRIARASKAIGIGVDKLSKAKQVVKAAENEPEKYAPLVEEMDRTGRVAGVYKKLRVAQAAEKVEAEPPPLPTGPFRVIVIDPPWTYRNRPDDPSHQVANPYPSMGLEEIEALPVGELAADDCILWLWTTNAHLPDAFGIVTAWGFKYKTLLTWAKRKLGIGDWLRGKTEHCLMAVKGNPVHRLTNQTTLLYGDAREHSRKPEEFYQLVEEICPGSKVELFARTERSGWTSHGNETGRFS